MNKYQTGNKILPTAQYASIKYDQGTKHIYPHFVWDSKLDPKKDIRGVRANNPLYSEPGEIMREILYSPSTNQPVDTTYREYPTALLPVKIQTRVASSNDQDRKEYEILKRRFNIAWNVSKPNIKYGIFKEGGLIPKYYDGRQIWWNTGYRGQARYANKKEAAADYANYIINSHKYDYYLKPYSSIYDPRYIDKNKFMSSNDFIRNFEQWLKNRYTSYGDVYQWSPQQQTQQKTQTVAKTPRTNAEDFDEHPMEAARKRYNGSPVTSDAQVKPPVQTPPTDEEFDLSENNPRVQEFLNKNGYVKLTPTDVSKNGNTAETVKPESETIKPEEQKQVTYSDILLQNTDIIKNRIFNSGWRGAFKDSLNRALMTPDYYNNGDGTQVYDFELPDGTIVNYDYLSENEMLNKHGLLKAGAMRKLAKNFKQQGRNIAQQRYIGIGNQQILNNSTPVVNIADTYEPNYGIKMIGATTPALGPDWNGMKNEVEKYQQKEPDITV